MKTFIVALAATFLTSTILAEDPSPTPDATIAMGQEFKLGDFTYKVSKAFAVGGIERHFQSALRPAEGAVFVVVEYSIRNDGKESDNMWVSGFKIEDAKGRKFEPSSEVGTEIEMRSKRNDMFVKQLQPGITRNLKEGFEIPLESLSASLALKISERGFFSTGVTKVNLVVTKLAKAKKSH